MKNLNKDKLKEVSGVFANGVKVTLTSRVNIGIAAFVGGFVSEGDITTGLYEGTKILIKGAVINGVAHVIVHELFDSEEVVKED